MSAAVVCPASVCRRYRQFLGALLDFQLADRRAHSVVALNSRLIEYKRVCVVALSYFCLAARCGEGRCLTVYKTGDRSFSCQGCAVVFFFCVRRRDRQCRSCHTQFADRVGAFSVIVAILDRPRERVVYCCFSNMRDRRRRCRRDRYFVARTQSELCLAFGAFNLFSTVGYRVGLVRMSAAVVCPASVCRRYRQFLGALLDFQLADRRAHSVVALNSRLIEYKRVCVVALSYFCLAARCGEGRCLTVYKTGDRSFSCQGCAVVFFFCVRRRDRQCRRCHTE